MLKVIPAIALVAFGCHGQTQAPAAATPIEAQLPAAHSPEQLARGAYVAAIAGCTTCHTPLMADGQLHDPSRELAGTELHVPGGMTVQVPNISPDADTGIGKWSDAQIIKAIREGVRPDGSRLAPLMPYPFYNRMTDADAASLVAYIRSEPPIQNRVARNQNLSMQPVTVTPPRGYVDRTNDPHAHGEYLATLMHCGACHTPQQGSFANQVFAGGTRFGDVVVPNITSDRETGIGTWSEDDVITAVRAMKDPEGHSLHAPMSEYREAWAQLTDSDARALAVYVKSVPAVHHDIEQEEQAPAPVSAR